MNSEAIIECVPNFSEGTDSSKVIRIVAAMQVPGISLLDWSLDTAHNRSVVTIAGPAEAVVESAVRGAGKAAELISGILFVLGLFTRIACLLIIGVMCYITFFLGKGIIWYDDQHPFLFILLALVFFFTGAGR